MPHECSLEADSRGKSVKWYTKLILVSKDHPLRFSYFRSNESVLQEELRHLRISKSTVHPFSKFRAWYEIYLIYLYASLLITKSVDAAFLRIRYQHGSNYVKYTLFTDFMAWIDIFMNFMTGYELRQKKLIELRRRQIAKNYILSPFFICDVISSVPKLVSLPFADASYRGYIFGTLDLMALCKIARLFSVIRCFWKMTEYFQITSKGAVFLCCAGILTVFTLHWMACLQFAIPKIVRRSFTKPPVRTSWFFVQNIYEQDFWTQYTHCFFKSSAYILGVRLSVYAAVATEEYILIIFTYLVGKIMIAFIWIILATAIINSRSIDIKFAEKINQLEEYMNQKRLPYNLRSRILQYFNFRFQGKYFEEELITSTLSTNLKKEINMHACKSLIKDVSLFNDLSPYEISKVITQLIPEIYMPHDMIVRSGAPADAMYFISSGTVALYTKSGMEVCHLQDGSYFGEICLVLKGQSRLIGVVAIETTYVYKLTKHGLDSCFKSNKKVMAKLIESANHRFKKLTKIDEYHQKIMFEQSHKGIE